MVGRRSKLPVIANMSSAFLSAAGLDLAAYLERIGYAGPVEPTLAVLQDLIKKHTTTITFENCDILLGREISIDLADVQRKLVHGKRGGYCLEQNILFRAVLIAIGFDVTPWLARVVYNAPADTHASRNHLCLRVEIPKDSSSSYLVDVGFGGLTPTAALELGTDADQITPHEIFRIVPWRDGHELLVQARNPHAANSEWINLYRALHCEPVYETDIEDTNHKMWTRSRMTETYVTM